jgi:hypothetical protein
MLYTLSHVNLPNETITLNMYFSDPLKLEVWIRRTYPNFTSYEVIAVNQRCQT